MHRHENYQGVLLFALMFEIYLVFSKPNVAFHSFEWSFFVAVMGLILGLSHFAFVAADVALMFYPSQTLKKALICIFGISKVLFVFGAFLDIPQEFVEIRNEMYRTCFVMTSIFIVRLLPEHLE